MQAHSVMVVVAGMIASEIALALGVPIAETRHGPPDSPVSARVERASRGALSADYARVEANASRILDAERLKVGESVLFTDEHPFGEPAGETEAFLFRDEVTVTDGEETQHIGISLIVNREGRILAAYTDSRAEWVWPLVVEHSVEEEARSEWWRVSPTASDSLRLSIGDVLSRVWARCRSCLPEAGQVVVRPRRVFTPFPGRRQGNDVIPRYAEGAFWIIEILGVYFPSYQSDGGYWSRVLMLIDDRTGDVLKAVYLP